MKNIKIKRELAYCSIALCWLSMACSSTEKRSYYESENLEIEAITENVFLHRSYLQTETWGKVGCNGMVYIKNGEAIIFDAPTNDEASLELIEWIGEKVNIKAVVANHFHFDCIGGLHAFHAAGISSYANAMTIELAQSDTTVKASTIPQMAFHDQLIIDIGGEQVINQYFGRGHTHDNIVSYVPSEKVLFGGCFVKALGAGKGNLADADTTTWSLSIKKVIEAFPDVAIVVPGHGKAGDGALLKFTADLFNQASNDSIN